MGARLSDVADARLPGLGVPRLTRPTRFARPATATRRPRAAAEVWFGEPGLARLPGLAQLPVLKAPVMDLAGSETPAAVASAAEFVLEGLHLSKRLNKDAAGARATYRAR